MNKIEFKKLLDDEFKKIEKIDNTPDSNKVVKEVLKKEAEEKLNKKYPNIK